MFTAFLLLDDGTVRHALFTRLVQQCVPHLRSAALCVGHL